MLGGVLCALITGCAARHSYDSADLTRGLPVRTQLDTVPFHPQEAYQCGPAALAMVLNWTGVQIEPETLVPEVYTPSRKGSLQPALVAGARRHGQIAYPISGFEILFKEVAAGHPVIVLLNLGLSWFPKWHYAVVIGYDFSEKTVLLHSGRMPRHPVSLRTFAWIWGRGQNWGLLVLGPRDLPATAEEVRYLDAVLGLEQIDQWESAVAGYETALKRWPGSLGALMGLGNTLYAMDELGRAEKMFRKASRLHPTSASAFNNLAHVLYEQGQDQEALESARRAVALGGPLIDSYRKTLKEIETNTGTRTLP